MEKVILHISDLHVTLYKKPNGTLNPKIDSYLTTNSDKTQSFYFIDAFIKKVKEDFSDCEFILLITGDIANQAEESEYSYAIEFINRIIVGLSISSENCLIIPGDHDVHRRSIDNALDKNPTSESHLLNDIKFAHFNDLYKEIKKEEFPFNKILIDYVVLENKIAMLAINSNYKINNEGGNGFIPIEEFRTEIQALKQKLSNPDLNFVACWHHNFTSAHENKNDGQWESDNRTALLAELENQNIKLVLTGNEHTSSSRSLLLGTINTTDAGAFASVNYDASFKCYDVKISDKVVLTNRIYGLVRSGDNDVRYYWSHRSSKDAKQVGSFELFVPNQQSIAESIDLPHKEPDTNTPVEQNSDAIGTPVVSHIFYDNNEIAAKLYSIVKEKKLFHSGHFHWSKSSRAHNWIDVSTLLEDNRDLYFAQNAIIDVLETFCLAEDCDLIIGLGYEGNIISSKASIKFDIPYTSLPYSYRYNDHHEYEKKLNYINDKKEYKKVIIITDVVNDGRTIRKLIQKREDEFFHNVDKIIVVSLFYTGHQAINTDILNFNRLPEGYDLQSDHEVNNIEFYTVKSMRVEKCPYGDNYKTECFIYKDELSCVHLFYDEEKTG